MVPPPMMESQPEPSWLPPLPVLAGQMTPSAGMPGASAARQRRVRTGSPLRLVPKVTGLG